MKYLRYSNFKVSFDLNPFVWSFVWHHAEPTRSDPKLHIFYLRILPLSFMLVIDDGTVVYPDPAEEVIGDEEL